jgi:immune inhibitor A
MESPVNNNNGSKAILIGIGVIIAVCCACALIVAAVGVVAYNRGTQTLETFDPNFTLDPGTPTPAPEVTRPPVENVSTDTIETLKNSIVPENNPYELACRLQGICNVAETLPPPAAPLEVGAQQQFWIANSNTDEHFQIDATLKYITPHTYFWAEDGADVNMNDLKSLMDTFENKIYPTDREFFGSEWTPGVDGDPHIYVVYSSNIGSTVAGYFSSADSYNPLVRKYSNGHEMYVLGTSQDLGDNYTYSTLAHEFVHMIQFPTDRNDVSWISEGFAELGAFLNGYDVGGADWLYTQNPDLQLNTWVDSNSPDFSSHYGASFLYLTYFLDRFGQDATKALTANHGCGHRQTHHRGRCLHRLCRGHVRAGQQGGRWTLHFS